MTFDTLRQQSTGTAVWAVHVKFPAFEEFIEKNFYWCTTENFDIGDDNEWLPLLQSCRGRHQRDRSNDYAEFSIVNPNNSTYQLIYPYEDLIEKAEVTIYECLEVEDGFFETEVRYVGYLADFHLNDKSKSMDFTSLSDMSRPGILVGGVVLTRERCRHEFNYNGLKAPEYDPCGWQTAQGGNPVYCSHYLKGIDGCEAHNNSHRFGAVTGLVDTPIQIIPPSDYSYNAPTGFEYEFSSCFSESVLVVMSDFSTKPINKVKVGDKVLGYDIFDNDKTVETEVLQTIKHLVNEIYILSFDDAILETTKEHLFYIGHRYFAPSIALDGFYGKNLAYGLDSKTKQLRSSKCVHKRESKEACTVFNLTTTSSNYVVTDRYGRFFFFVHNMKWEQYLN